MPALPQTHTHLSFISPTKYHFCLETQITAPSAAMTLKPSKFVLVYLLICDFLLKLISENSCKAFASVFIRETKMMKQFSLSMSLFLQKDLKQLRQNSFDDENSCPPTPSGPSPPPTREPRGSTPGSTTGSTSSRSAGHTTGSVSEQGKGEGEMPMKRNHSTSCLESE